MAELMKKSIDERPENVFEKASGAVQQAGYRLKGSHHELKLLSFTVKGREETFYLQISPSAGGAVVSAAPGWPRLAEQKDSEEVYSLLKNVLNHIG